MSTDVPICGVNSGQVFHPMCVYVLWNHTRNVYFEGLLKGDLSKIRILLNLGIVVVLLFTPFACLALSSLHGQWPTFSNLIECNWQLGCWWWDGDSMPARWQEWVNRVRIRKDGHAWTRNWQSWTLGWFPRDMATMVSSVGNKWSLVRT